MGFTTFSGPIRAGTVKGGASRNAGLVVLSQSLDSGDMTGDTVGSVDTAAFKLPAGAQVIDIIHDQVVASTTGTTTMSVGTTSGGAELSATVATTAGGRFRGSATAATQLAWQLAANTDTTVYVRNTTGTATLGAGRVITTVLYIQRSPSGSQHPDTA
jgi:hypothetical protein